MSRKAINFDLDTKKLQQFYPNKDYHQAYRDIRGFLEKNGFEHRQWSGYTSKKSMSDIQTQVILDAMFNKYPWLNQCANKVDITNISKSHDYLQKRSNFQSQSSYKFISITDEQYAELQKSGISFEAQPNVEGGKIIKYAATDDQNIKNIVSSLEGNKPTPKR